MHRRVLSVLVIFFIAACATQPAQSSPERSGKPRSSPPTAANPSPSDGSITTFEDIAPGTELDPGAYVLHYASIGGAVAYPTLSMMFTVPSDWTRVAIDGLVWNDTGPRLLFATADNVYIDGCDTASGLSEPPIGASVADLVTALKELPGWEGAAVTDGDFAGRPGTRIEVSQDAAACEEERLLHSPGFPGYTLAPDAERFMVWVMDVDGTRLVITGINPVGASAEMKAELQAVMDSIVVQP